MCGRYYRKSDKQKISEAFQATKVDDFPLPPWDYNVAPTSVQPIIRNSRDSGERELASMRWGLIPFFTKSLNDFSTINARAETVTKSATFREPFKKRRWLVPASGFYECKKLDAKNKQPFAFDLPDGKILAFAGLWDAWKETADIGEKRYAAAIRGAILRKEELTPEKLAEIEASREPQWLQSYTIITTEANELMAPVHDRMPGILHPSDFNRWLDREPGDQPPIDQLRPFPADEVEAIAEVGFLLSDDRIHP
jgi:putative SOS response-associated peptidase YedK